LGREGGVKNASDDPKSGDRAVLDASGIATAELSSGSARDTPSRVESHRKIARE